MLSTQVFGLSNDPHAEGESTSTQRVDRCGDIQADRTATHNSWVVIVPFCLRQLDGEQSLFRSHGNASPERYPLISAETVWRIGACSAHIANPDPWNLWKSVCSMHPLASIEHVKNPTGRHSPTSGAFSSRLL